MNKERMKIRTTKSGRKKYSLEFKDQALALVKQQGLPKTAIGFFYQNRCHAHGVVNNKNQDLPLEFKN